MNYADININNRFQRSSSVSFRRHTSTYCGVEIWRSLAIARTNVPTSNTKAN